MDLKIAVSPQIVTNAGVTNGFLYPYPCEHFINKGTLTGTFF